MNYIMPFLERVIGFIDLSQNWFVLPICLVFFPHSVCIVALLKKPIGILRILTSAFMAGASISALMIIVYFCNGDDALVSKWAMRGFISLCAFILITWVQGMYISEILNNKEQIRITEIVGHVSKNFKGTT